MSEARPVDPIGQESIEQIGISDLLLRLWRHKLRVIVTAIIFFLLGALYLRSAPVRYTAVLQATSATFGPRGANGGGAISTFASLAGIAGSTSASPFDLYLASLTSRAVADDLARDRTIMRAVFANEVDPARGGWREPPSRLGAVKTTLLRAFGIAVQPWRAPDAARLQAYLAHEIVTGRASANSPITNISFTHSDPRFAAVLLNQISQSADNRVRRADLARARNYIAYLTIKLATVTLAEQRFAIAGILADQERQAMIASSGLSYAAQTIEPAAVPITPSSTPPVLVLFAAMLLGALVGGFLALVDFGPTGVKFRLPR